MTRSEETRRTRLDAEDRREQILAAAQRLFAKSAYHAVSTSELAAAAGTTRTNLHHHFGTKRDLYLEVVRRFARLPDPPAVVGRGGDAAQMFDRWLDSVEQNRETYLSMIGVGSPRRDPEVEAALHAGMRAWEDRLLAALDAPGTERNRALVRAFQAMVSAATDEWLRCDTLDRSDVHDLLTRGLLALRTEPARSS
ncbi:MULTISPECIES: TetR/AcrR family transcriptional regulator [Amycolatopsis]|uniref:TetR/AcrR family transcriptional regulator n=1 Tax=Amycolatopsis TaxID=1813 RepID=UPI000B8B66E9|nr:MULTISPECIES: TetR/AcrR family transcriptional regulator [Amycolatopsis]OXM67166.1 TetR family transcriptional regulator [Amycolatopsis sp. KNN50.9b]